LSAYSLLYVSRSLVHDDTAEVAIADIVTVSRRRNVDLGVCGALLFTGRKFAQVLEGPRVGVEELMASIVADGRHTDIITIQEGDIDRTRFSKWALAYCGPSAFVGRIVDQALDDAAALRSSARGETLLMLFEEFASIK
jgi:hypothetical protein